MRRIIGILLAFVMIFMSVSALEGVVMVKADEPTTIYFNDVTITGIIGTPIEEQDFEIYVENGKFDVAQFYIGKDISNLMRGDGRARTDGFRRYIVEGGYDSSWGYIDTYTLPYGLKAIVTEATEEKITCTISGTPLSPSKESISVMIRNEMFSEFTVNPTYPTRLYPLKKSNSKGKYNITFEDGTAVDQNNELKAVIAGIETKDLKGTAGVTNLDVDFTVTLSQGIFAKDIPVDTDVSTWFTSNGSNLPVGVYAKTIEKISAGDTSCKLKIYGTPKYKNSSQLCLYTPESCVIGYKYNYGRSGDTHWRGEKATCFTNLYFDITGTDDEAPYLRINDQKLYVYAGYNYCKNQTLTSGDHADEPELPSFKVQLYNARFVSNPAKPDGNPNGQYYSENAPKYSNIKGNFDTTSASGFLYSPAKTEGDIKILEFYAGNFSASSYDQLFRMPLWGTFYSVGEYDASLMLDYTDTVEYNSQVGRTEPALDKAKLIVMKPFQLDVDDAEIIATIGKQVDTYFTVIVSKYSLTYLKENLTKETLKYKKTKKCNDLELDIEPVVVNKTSVVFHLTGNVAGPAEIVNLSDLVTFDYSNFEDTFNDNFEDGSTVKQVQIADVSRFGDIEVNTSANAVLNVKRGTYGVPGQEIDYSPREDVKIYPTNKSGAKVETTYINMTQEKLVTDMSIKCYSTDGGTKWKEAKSALNEKGFQKLLLKGMTLAIADKWDSKEKAPASDAVILTFPQTEKQATKPKFKIDYVTYADATGETTGQFILTDAEGTAYTANALRSTYEIGIASGKSLNEDGYGVWPVNGGLTIAKVESNKVQKTVYYVRVAATTTTPASKEVKVSVAGQQKAPNLKIDYKKEIIKGKEGLTVKCGETYLAKNISKEDAKEAFKEISIAAHLTVGERAVFDIWQSATAKKPASAIQTINAAARAEAATSTADVVTLSKGKLSLKKGYEAYDTDKQKWGGLPKIEASCVILIRKKADAKAGKENDTTYASGETMKLEVTYGVTDESKNKSGVTAAILESEKNASQSSGSGDNTSGSGGNTSGSGGNTGESGGNTQ